MNLWYSSPYGPYPEKKEKEKHAPYLPSRQASRVHQWRLRIYGAATCHFLRTSLVSQKSNCQEDKSKEHHISYQNRDTSVFFPFLMLFRGCSKVKYHQISGMMWRELLSKVAISHCVRMMKIWSTRLLQSISEGVIRVLYHLLGIPSFAPSRAAILILVSWLHCE